MSDDLFALAECRIDLANALSALEHTRDRQVIIAIFGLAGDNPLTRKEIAEQMHLSVSRVAQIEGRGMKALKRNLTNGGYRSAT